MKISMKELTDLRAQMQASNELEGWINGAKMFAFMSGVVEAGLLNELATGKSIDQLTAITGIDRQVINDLCLVMEAHGIIERKGDRFHLTHDYALIMSPTAPVTLTNKIAQAKVMIRTLAASGDSSTSYTSLRSEEMLAMAQGAGISALSSSPRVGQVTICQAMPEVEARWQAGAHHLEVGCGVGNSLFGTVLAYPKVTAVGVEIDGTTALEAGRRAQELGVEDRVVVRNMDACDIQDARAFDTIQWSQFFFPAESRLPVLKAMRRSLKPGGLLFMPWLGSVSKDTAPKRGQMLRKALRALVTDGSAAVPYLNDLVSDTPARRKQEKQTAMMQQLLFHQWGVPVHSAADLKVEVQEGGFNVLRVTRTPASQFAMTRGFLLAQRDRE